MKGAQSSNIARLVDAVVAAASDDSLATGLVLGAALTQVRQHAAPLQCCATLLALPEVEHIITVAQWC